MSILKCTATAVDMMSTVVQHVDRCSHDPILDSVSTQDTIRNCKLAPMTRTYRVSWDLDIRLINKATMVAKYL